jgi:FG-GAP repeat
MVGSRPAQVTLSSPNATTQGYFGQSVATNGKLVVVGASSESVSGLTGAGRAYLFNASTGSLLANLTSPNAATGGRFGWSVAVDGNLVVVGAPYESFNGWTSAGHVYVFSAKTGNLLYTLFSFFPQDDGIFGYSVAVSIGTVIAGAPGETQLGKIQAGAVYAFNFTSKGSSFMRTSPSVAQSQGYFGWSVAASGKIYVAGAPGEIVDGNQFAGHAYIFNLTNGYYLNTLSPPAPKFTGYFGQAVAVKGDLVVVGSPGSKHAYTFDASSGTLLGTLSSPKKGNGFGSAIATNGKVVSVGAYKEASNGFAEAGRVYTFNATGFLLNKLASPNAQSGGNFGWSVSIGSRTFVVGARGETADNMSQAGNVYVF